MAEREGVVTGAPNLILRAEGAGVLVAACWAYGAVGGSWWLFAVLFLTPDLSMLGYLRGARVGALGYNLGHTYLAPLLLLAVGQGTGLATGLATVLGLIWAAHIGFDRMLGYGLKYPWAFKATHLSGGVTAASPATPSARA